jgi:hypothetical protein
MALTTMNEEKDIDEGSLPSSESDHDSDHTGSATTEVEEKGETLAAGETKAVNAGKVLVFGVLIIAAVAMGWLTYWFVSDDEQDAFESSVGCHSL